MWTRSVLALVVVVGSSVARADSVALKGGVSIDDCTVLQDGTAHVAILYGTSVLRIERGEIEAVTKAPARAVAPVAAAVQNHLPDYRSIVVKLSGENWAAELQQIPATVISVGVLRNVPYKSHRAGDDYEINVYGDPNSPAGFEIGVKNALLNDAKAKAHCVDFVCSLLKDPTDRDAVRALKTEKDLVVRNGVSYEITPSTDPDAYGGWWVSVYSETALNGVRASEAEMAAITVAKDAPLAVAVPVQQTQPPVLVEVERRNAWTTEDMRRARVVRVEPQHPNANERVYVRGFTRHEGVYVPHHRR